MTTNDSINPFDLLGDCQDCWHPLSSTRKVVRTQRHPQYSDDEMKPFFAEIAKGYCVNQSADRCEYPRKWVWNTIYSDDDTAGYVLDLSMEAGGKIRAGLMAPPPDRYDGLWNEYI